MRPGSLALRLCLWALAGGLLASCQTEALRPPSPPEPARESSPALRYTITYVREPERALDVEVVRGTGAPRDFLFTQEGGVRAVQAYSRTGEVRVLQAEDSVITVPADTRVLRYRFSLEDQRRRGRWWNFSAGLTSGEDALLLAGRSWLIRPRVAEPGVRVELSVKGTEALLPWQPGPDGQYHLSAEDLVDSGFQAFGGRRCQAQLTEAVLDVAIVGEMTHVDDAQLCDWLRQRAEEVRYVRRRFPFPRISVSLYPVPGRGEANVFGMVMWSSPPSVALLVGQDVRLDALQRDWTALHELLHLTHPTFVPRAAWISEGLATYFTELVQARSGRMSAEAVWAEMIRGFQRGRAQASGQTMQEMIDDNAPPGLYWVGAFFCLRLDVELRRATQNQRGLQDVLELLATQGSTSTVDGYGAAVDAVAGKPIFRALLEEDLRRPAFAGLEGLLEALGVTPLPAGVKLKPARDSVLREALDGQNAPRIQE